MAIKEKFDAVIHKYKQHPEFLGIEITNPNQPGAVDDTLLHIAARTGDVESIEVLIDAGADVNIVGDLGNTPLHAAALRGQINSVKILLRRGANPSIKNEFGETAKEVAELVGYIDIANLLEKEAKDS